MGLLRAGRQGDLYVGGTAVVVRITPAPGSSLIDGSPGEQLTTVAGYPILTNAPYQGDGGRALDANLNGLFGIEILPNGDLVIADTSASRIRRVFAGGDGVVNGGTDETIETARTLRIPTPCRSTRATRFRRHSATHWMWSSIRVAASPSWMASSIVFVTSACSPQEGIPPRLY